MTPLSKQGNISKIKRITFLVCLTLSVISFIITTFFIWRHVKFQRDTISNTKEKLEDLTIKATVEIETIFREAMEKVDTIAHNLSTGKLGKPEMLNQIKKLVTDNPTFYGSSIAYRPFGFESGKRLYAPYFHRNNKEPSELVFTQLEENYDYTLPDKDWFVVPMKEGNRWGEPYWDEAAETYMITYSSVFYSTGDLTGGKNPLGVVTVDISMNYIQNIIENIDLGSSGFGALTSRKGVYLYHPVTEYVISKKTIKEVAQEKNDPDRLIMAEKAEKGEGGILDHISTTTQQKAWLVFAPIPLTGWSLQNTFLKNDIEFDVDAFRHQLIWIVLSGLIFVLLALACIQFKIAESRTNQWILVALGSLLIVCSVGCIWEIALRYNPITKNAGTKILDKATLEHVMKEYENRSEKFHLEPPVFVPTGVFIEAIKFTGPNDVSLSGYIWQKYDSGFPEDAGKELMISKASSVSIEKVRSFYQNGVETIQFYFEAEIQQKLTHKTYPIEEELIELRMVHKELDHNIVLTPDLDAYKVRSASQRPGLDKGTFLSGWKILNSYYELRSRDINTNFGIIQNVDKDYLPILYFNIGIQRNFIDAFISNLTPIIIVSIMLFFLMMLADKIDTAKVFSTCIAMFFVIVFSHIDIRGKISAQEIFYLEYFFFITYALIVYVSLNAIGILKQTNNWFYQYNKGVYTLLYWPVLLSLTLIVTVITFY